MRAMLTLPQTHALLQRFSCFLQLQCVKRCAHACVLKEKLLQLAHNYVTFLVVIKFLEFYIKQTFHFNTQNGVLPPTELLKLLRDTLATLPRVTFVLPSTCKTCVRVPASAPPLTWPGESSGFRIDCIMIPNDRQHTPVVANAGRRSVVLQALSSTNVKLTWECNKHCRW